MDPDEMLELCDEVLYEIDQLPDRAYDFQESVRETVIGIRDTVEETEYVTDNQVDAVQNIQGGVRRWLERED